MKKTVATMLLGMLFAGSALASDTVQWESKTIEYNGPKFTCDTTIDNEVIAKITYGNEDEDLRRVTSAVAPGAQFRISTGVFYEKDGITSVSLPIAEYSDLVKLNFTNNSTTTQASNITDFEITVYNTSPYVEKIDYTFGFEFTDKEPIDEDVKYTVEVVAICEAVESHELPEFLK